MKELQRQASPSIVIALAGNKADLVNKRVVEFDEAQTYADENGLLFMETSAKTAMNVNDIFLAIGKIILYHFVARVTSIFIPKTNAPETCTYLDCSIINLLSAM